MTSETAQSLPDDSEAHLRDLRRRADQAATRAETEGSQGLPDLVLLLRRRGRVSARRAMALFAMLVFVILLGLVYYLGQSLWRVLSDGRRQALTEQVQALTATVPT